MGGMWQPTGEQAPKNNTPPNKSPTGGPSAGEIPVSGGRVFTPVGDRTPRPRPPGKAMTEIVVAKDPDPGVRATAQGWDGVRRRYLPRELRIRLFEEVKRLRRRGLTYSEMVYEVWRRHGVRLSKSQISEWTRGIHSPYNGRYIPSIELLKPSEELAYIIGVILGDGYATKKRRTVKSYNNVKIGLEVKDREFAEEFARCLTKVLGRRPIKPRYNNMGRYIIQIHSETLYELLKKPVDLDGLKRYIEHCGKCMTAFLRGFFDSEGCVNMRGRVSLCNTDLRLLKYVKDLLNRLGIESTGPRPHRRQGKTFYDPKKMKRYMHKREVYYIYIRAGSNLKFYRKIGLTIRRKRKRLEKYLRRCQAQPPSPHSLPIIST